MNEESWSLPKLKTKTWLKIYYVTTLVIIVGLAITIGLMFNYLKTINHNVQQTDQDVQSVCSALNNCSTSYLP